MYVLWKPCRKLCDAEINNADNSIAQLVQQAEEEKAAREAAQAQAEAEAAAAQEQEQDAEESSDDYEEDTDSYEEDSSDSQDSSETEGSEDTSEDSGDSDDSACEKCFAHIQWQAVDRSDCFYVFFILFLFFLTEIIVWHNIKPFWLKIRNFDTLGYWERSKE